MLAVGRVHRLLGARKFVAYYRVSTRRQGDSGLGLDAQRRAVRDYLDGGSWQLVGEFTEVESGKHAARPELAKALGQCKRERAKLVIAKLDLSRNVAFLATLMDRGVDFVACDNPHANKLTIHILAAVAQHERETIAQRTKDALAAAKRRGVKLGGPKLDVAQEVSRHRRKALADQHAANVVPIILDVQRAGLKSLRAIADALNARGVPTARGGAWHASSVRDALKRVEVRT
jgi:DNA invertase Pin-like site-specific DNA recombinase